MLDSQTPSENKYKMQNLTTGNKKATFSDQTADGIPRQKQTPDAAEVSILFIGGL